MEHKPLSQAIAYAADLIDRIAQREAHHRATELIGPAMERIDDRNPAAAIDGWTFDAPVTA